MAVRFWLTRPRMAVARLRYWVWERMNPDKPWMCPGSIAFCQTHLTKSMTAMEFGSGRSTRWFSTLIGTLTSVEHDARWHAQVTQQLADAGVTNVDYRLVPLDHPECDSYSPPPAYVAAADGVPDRSLGLAVVDGHYRTNCVRHLVPKIAPGG